MQTFVGLMAIKISSLRIPLGFGLIVEKKMAQAEDIILSTEKD